MLCCLALARAYWAWGDVEAAFDEVERAVEFASQMGFSQAMRDARACQARYWLLQGRVALAHRWADSNDLDPYLPPTYERQSEYLTFARLLIADELPELALTILDATDELAIAQGRVADRLEISLLRALAYKASGDHTEAHRGVPRGARHRGTGGIRPRLCRRGHRRSCRSCAMPPPAAPSATTRSDC